MRDIVQLSGRHTTSVSWQYIVFIPMNKYNASSRMNTKILAKQLSTIGKEKTHRIVEICLHNDESTSHLDSKKKKISLNNIRLLESQKIVKTMKI